MKSTESSNNKESLRHHKYLVYMQILAAFCITLIAGQIFEVFTISSTFAFLSVNNFVIAGVVGLIGFLFLRGKLKEIEDRV